MAGKKQTYSARWALDSNVLIAMFKGNETQRGIETSKWSQNLIEFAFENNIPLIVSALAIVEVFKPHPRRNHQPGHETIEDMDDFLRRPNVELVEVGRASARISRNLCNEWDMPSWDAIHVATAISAGATTFFCWDIKDVTKHESIDGVRLASPTEYELHTLINTKEPDPVPIEELPLFIPFEDLWSKS